MFVLIILSVRRSCVTQFRVVTFNAPLAGRPHTYCRSKHFSFFPRRYCYEYMMDVLHKYGFLQSGTGGGSSEVSHDIIWYGYDFFSMIYLPLRRCFVCPTRKTIQFKLSVLDGFCVDTRVIHHLRALVLYHTSPSPVLHSTRDSLSAAVPHYVISEYSSTSILLCSIIFVHI